jgi:hypothetical protein
VADPAPIPTSSNRPASCISTPTGPPPRSASSSALAVAPSSITSPSRKCVQHKLYPRAATLLLGLIGELSVEEKTSSRRIAEADVVGCWLISGRSPQTITGKTDKEGKFTTAVRVDTDTPEKCTLLITTIKKAGYTSDISPSTPVHRRWNGIQLLDGPHGTGTPTDPDGELVLNPTSPLFSQYGYSAAVYVSTDARHRALERAVEDPNGLGLAYVVRWITNFNQFTKNTPTHIKAVERRNADVLWLKTTYYDRLKVKHFCFPPIYT